MNGQINPPISGEFSRCSLETAPLQLIPASAESPHMSTKFTALFAALLVSTSLVATAAEAGAGAKNQSTTASVAISRFQARQDRLISRRKYPAGSIVVNTQANALSIYVLGNGKAVKYAVATAEEGLRMVGRT